MYKIVKLNLQFEKRLADFFDEIGRNAFFHPHEFTKEKAHEISNYTGKDCYYIVLKNEWIVGYGMLRGWDEGYEIPSLGIIIGEKEQGHGLGRKFMQFLHEQVIEHGVHKVRLTVYKENKIAKGLYESLGYVFSELEDCFVGYLELE